MKTEQPQNLERSKMNRQTRNLFFSTCSALLGFLFDFRSAELWHPESLGEKITVTRSRFGRLFKPSCFATISECLKIGVVWKTMGNHFSCPVCGYYCLGDGGHGCIDKPSMCDLDT